ncbi:MAG: preprotein translocase subunit YajC [Fimbriimonadales bacterium]
MRFGVLRDLLHGLVAQTAADGAGGLGGLLFPITMIGVLMYFLIIRPQQQEQKKAQEVRSQLKKGDEIVLLSGIFGKVSEVRADDLIVEIAANVKIRVQKSAVAGPAPTAVPKTEPKGAEAEKKT